MYGLRRCCAGLVVSVLLLACFSTPVLAQEYPAVRGALAAEVEAGSDVALVVAVEEYFRLPDVPGARQTGQDWVSFFREGLGVGRVYDLFDQEATREALLRVVGQALEEVGEEGTLWVVFVGHGAPAADGSDGLLVGVDAQQNVESLMARSLRQGELLERLEAGGQARTVLFLDACFSGRDQGGETLVPGLQPVLPVAHEPRVERGSVVLSAARSDEFAGPLPGADRPAFSYFMLGALRGWATEGDTVTARQALDFTRTKLRSIPDRVQTPSGSGELDLVLVRGVSEEDPLVGWDGRKPQVIREVQRASEAQPQQPQPSSRYARQTTGLELNHWGREWRLFDRHSGQVYRGASIYEQLGRADLMERYEENERARQQGLMRSNIVAASGAAVVVAGLVMFAVVAGQEVELDAGTRASCAEEPLGLLRENCLAYEAHAAKAGPRTTSLIIGGVGLGLATTGVVLRTRAHRQNVHPLTPSETLELVDEVNETRRSEIKMELVPQLAVGEALQGGIGLRVRW